MIMPQPDAHETKPFFGAVSIAHYILYSHIVLRSLWIIKINPKLLIFSNMFGPVANCSPHLCVGFVVHSRLPPPSSPPPDASLTHDLLTHTTYSHTTCSHTTCSHTTCFHTTCSHTTCPRTTCSHTHNLLTHNIFTHTTCTHTQLADTQLTYTQLVHTHNIFTHNLSAHHLLTHNLLTHNLLPHNMLTHNLSTHNLLTHNLLTHTTCSHTTYSHTQLAHTHNLLTHNLLTHNLSTHTQHIHTQLVHTPLAHTQLTHTQHIHKRTQLVHTQPASTHTTCTHTHTSRSHTACSHATYPHTHKHTHTQLGYIQSHLVWQAWHLVTSTLRLRGRHGTYGTGLALVTRLVRAGRRWRRGLLRGMRGTWRHPGPFGGKCGTWWHRPCVCVAGMALMALGWLLVRAGPRWRCGLLCGRRGTWRPPKAFGVAALGDIDLAFAWQAWHLLHWAGSCDALGPRWSPVTPPSLSHSVFTFFWWLIGRSWHVGLSGPLIYVFLDTLTLEFKRPYKRRPLYRGPILK